MSWIEGARGSCAEILVDYCAAVRGKEMDKKGMKGIWLGCCGEEKRGKRERRCSADVAATGGGVWRCASCLYKRNMKRESASGGTNERKGRKRKVQRLLWVSGFVGEEKIQRGRGESEADLFCASVIRFFGYCVRKEND
ncbi:hypothetical protein HAX54_046563, partial [Datura stramonium]|nr:hypothetical protein [Datura stramonium]